MLTMNGPIGTPLALASNIPPAFYVAPVAGVLALLTAYAFAVSIRKRSEGDPEMVRIAEAVRQGAMAYLRAQYRVVASVFAVLVMVLAGLAVMGLQPFWSAVGVPLAGFLSAISGWFGMRMATSASARTAAAAKQSLNDGLTVAFRAGAVMGLTVVGLAILDVSFWFFVFTTFGERLGIDAGLREIVAILISYKMGASLQALFARVGGGIYTKAADVGADLVGKVEAGIPEDDPRNPAVIADNVGDNVGDVAGMGADLYESYYSAVIAALALGVAAAFSVPDLGSGEQAAMAMLLAITPIVLAGVGILASIVGVFAVRVKEGATFAQLLGGINTGIYTASGLFLVAAVAVPWVLLRGSATLNEVTPWWGFAASIITGLITGLVIARWTEYCTSYEHEPTKRIARQAATGPATVIIAGIAEGMKSTWVSVLAVAVAILLAFDFSGGGENFLFGLYGVGIAAVGMLATLGITLATDAYGPIADNAGGNAEMSGQPSFVRERTDKLDSLGNTTAATGKGFAIGSAALTALALLVAYIQVVQTQQITQAAATAQAAITSGYAGMTMKSGVTPDRPHAIYKGSGSFAIVVPSATAGEPAYVDAAMIERSRLQEHVLEALKPGMVLPIRPTFEVEEADVRDVLAESRILVVDAEVGHDDHSHFYEQEIIAVRRSSVQDLLRFYDANFTSPRALAGMFIGVLITFLFCALTMNAVGRAAFAMMGECRRQFGIIRRALRDRGMSDDQIADPHHWPVSVEVEGKAYPDYATCVEISTRGALREMIVPSLIAVLVPVLVGLTLSVAGVLGLLAGGLITGFAVAVFMANAGGAWDNAKKLIESYGKITANAALDDAAVRERIPAELRENVLAKATELRRIGRGETIVYGKGSDDHKAAVVGDTVGDPFKDTSGPSLNILIKLLSSVAVVFAGVTIKFGPAISGFLGLD